MRAVTRAVNNLVAPHRLTSDAVDTRQELDLRIGISQLLIFVLSDNVTLMCVITGCWRIELIAQLHCGKKSSDPLIVAW